jgi:hypothetical protein
LVAAKQWPEVQEALTGAFRMLQERKGAKTGGNESELKPIKVNQGEKNFKRKEMQTGLEGCPPAWRESQPQSACFAGSVPDGPSCRIRLRYATARRGATNSTSHGLKKGHGLQESVAAPAAVGGRTDGNEAEFGSIKVDQGDKFYLQDGKIEDEDEKEDEPYLPAIEISTAGLFPLHSQ